MRVFSLKCIVPWCTTATYFLITFSSFSIQSINPSESLQLFPCYFQFFLNPLEHSSRDYSESLRENVVSPVNLN